MPSRSGSDAGLMMDVGVAGRVLLENKLPPPEPIPVTLACVGFRASSSTDSKGRFFIPVGQAISGSQGYHVLGVSISRCELQVRIPGMEPYRKEIKPDKQADAGVIMLRAAPGVGGTVISANSYSAPQRARNEYVRALELVGEKNFDEALKHLDKVIELYPRYAAAHFSKGQILDRRGLRDQARAAFQVAAEVDPNYLPPLIELTMMAAEENDPARTSELAARVIGLAPGYSPEIYLIHGGANYNLGLLDAAITSARAGISADTARSFPRLHKLLGETLVLKKDYAGAADQFELYTQSAPRDSPDIDEVRAKAVSMRKLAKMAEDYRKP